MAEKETKNKPKDLVEATPEEVKKVEEVSAAPKKFGDRRPPRRARPDRDQEAREALASWAPKTKLGIAVRDGKEKDLDKIIIHGKKILESEIVEKLLDLKSDLLSIGQAKGKFGGGKRRAWRQTQKKTKEGNVLSFSSMAVVGDKAGHVGVGYGGSKETLPARAKAVRNAKLSIIRVARGFESPEAEKDKSDPHTVPFKVEGKCGSVRVIFWPAPRGTGLVAGDEAKKILRLAGIKDVYSRTLGKTKTTFNLAKACVDALNKTTEMKQ